MCRTANGYDTNFIDVFKYNIDKILNDKENEIINYCSGAQKDGRGNICPATIIMPTLAMMAKEQEGDIIENFMKILDKKIAEGRDMLLERF